MFICQNVATFFNWIKNSGLCFCKSVDEKHLVRYDPSSSSCPCVFVLLGTFEERGLSQMCSQQRTPSDLRNTKTVSYRWTLCYIYTLVLLMLWEQDFLIKPSWCEAHQGPTCTCRCSRRECPIHQTHKSSSPASHTQSDWERNIERRSGQEKRQWSVNSWCLDQAIVPWAGGRCFARYDRLIPDGEVGVKDVQRVAAAIGLWVWTGKHSAEHEQFTPKHATAVVGQRRNLPLGLEETGGTWRKGAKMTLKQAKTHTAHLHHGPLPALRVQDVNVVEPLFVFGSSKHKDPPRARVVDGCVADPALGCRALGQSLCCNPGCVLCRTETKALALTWSHSRIKHTVLTGERNGPADLCRASTWGLCRTAAWLPALQSE